DAGHGACWLREPALASLVADALQHFHGTRYTLEDFVVMPNHVHILVTPLKDHALSENLHSWKSFSAKQVNRAIGRTGTVWQDESFDHIVRSAAQLAHFHDYIRSNPAAAHLKPGQYVLGSGSAK
ncbi:MAG: transposase, partial [Verrucomicrobia bacterium]|nr:transposase [Verrucomicrobiota bacterium]